MRQHVTNSQASRVHSIWRPGFKPVNKFSLDPYTKNFDAISPDLAKIGVHINHEDLLEMAEAQRKALVRAIRANGGKINPSLAMDIRQSFGMDGLQPTVSTPSITTPVQFLQAWMPGFVNNATSARNIDDFIGMMMIGAWEDEEVIFGLLDRTGSPVPYQDDTNVPLASFNVNYFKFTVTRWELGMRLGRLAELRASRMNLDAASAMRSSVLLQLEILRNVIGFLGYNNGQNRTFGFLNAENSPAYVTVATKASGDTFWSGATMLEIISDLLTAITLLFTQSGGLIDPLKIPTTLGLSTNTRNFLSVSSDLGYSVYKWLKENYPLIRVTSAPQLDEANGGENVFYLWADRYVEDDSTDGGQTYIQAVQSKYKVLGVQPTTKGFEEDYASGTAGTLLKRPWAIVRFTGV